MCFYFIYIFQLLLWGFLFFFCLGHFSLPHLISVFCRYVISSKTCFDGFMMKVSGWGQLHNPSEHLNFMVQKCFLSVLFPPSCCCCTLNAGGSFVGRAIPSGWASVPVTHGFCVWDCVQLLSPNATLFLEGSGAFRNPPSSVPVVWLVALSLVWDEAHHWFCWICVHLDGVQTQVTSRHCVYLALGYLSIAPRVLTFCVHVYYNCAFEGPTCVRVSSFLLGTGGSSV